MIKSILIGIVGLILLSFLIIVVIPYIFSSWEHQQKVEWLNNNFENPVVYSDGRVLEGNNPCAFYSDPTPCLQNKARADERNREIQAQNQKTYMSIEQHENSLVTPYLNYYLFDQNRDAKKAIESGNCERIQSHLDFAKKSLKESKNNKSFSEGQKIMYSELVDDHETNLQNCFEKNIE